MSKHEQCDGSKYYDNLTANIYDDLWGFTYDYIAEFAVKHLQLKPDDLLADIGAGTGAISHLIWKKAGLSVPVLCVEPSVEMLQGAEKKNSVNPYLADADTFFTKANTSATLKCNKMLMNCCVHLFPNTQETFQRAFDYLPENGLLVVIARSTMCTFPMWQSLKERFTPMPLPLYKEYLEIVEFDVTMAIESHTTKMAKCDWYDKVRRRIFTTLSQFSDEEIEKGTRELDQSLFHKKMEQDLVEIKDTIVFFTATKL